MLFQVKATRSDRTRKAPELIDLFTALGRQTVNPRGSWAGSQRSKEAERTIMPRCAP